MELIHQITRGGIKCFVMDIYSMAVPRWVSDTCLGLWILSDSRDRPTEKRLGGAEPYMRRKDVPYHFAFAQLMLQAYCPNLRAVVSCGRFVEQHKLQLMSSPHSPRDELPLLPSILPVPPATDLVTTPTTPTSIEGPFSWSTDDHIDHPEYLKKHCKIERLIANKDAIRRLSLRVGMDFDTRPLEAMITKRLQRQELAIQDAEQWERDELVGIEQSTEMMRQEVVTQCVEHCIAQVGSFRTQSEMIEYAKGKGWLAMTLHDRRDTFAGDADLRALVSDPQEAGRGQRRKRLDVY